MSADGLIEWLRAQLDHDELWALAASAPKHVRHDPARILAEVDAKRRILDARQKQIDDDDPYVYLAGDILLRLLALPYAHHPGYREEWRP